MSAGSIIGGGTVAMADESRGASCIAEQRIIEAISHGEPKTPWLKFGDRVRIEILNELGASVFGAIDQEVARISGANLTKCLQRNTSGSRAGRSDAG
jgi:fumarylacetoacetate (FAA) hydrolase